MHLDGSVVFVRLCQCAPLSNTCFFGPTQVHTSDDIAIGSAIFAQLTAEGGYASQIAAPFPSKLPFTWGFRIPWANQSSHPKWHLDRFSHFCMAHDRDRQTTLDGSRCHLVWGPSSPPTAAPSLAHVHCGQMVAHLSCCWASVKMGFIITISSNFKNAGWWTAAILKIEKSPYHSNHLINWLLWNLDQWCIQPRAPTDHRILEIQDDWVAAILITEKSWMSLLILQTVNC